MKTVQRSLSMFLLAMLLMVPTMVQAGQTRTLTPKIASFDFFVDDSGSMMMQHEKIKKPKMAIAKEVLAKINSAIPALPYKASMHTFAPFNEVVTYGPYNKATFENGIMNLKSDLDIYARRTPLGDGLEMLRPAANKMDHKAAVILVSDGGSNIGSDPVTQATMLTKNNPGLCLHVISVGEDAAGNAMLNKIADISSCSVKVRAEDLLADDQALSAFMQSVFYTIHDEATPVAMVTPTDVIVLRSVQFAFDSAKLTTEAESVLSEAAVLIEERPNAKVTLAGHTDSTGPEVYNMKLSQRRAEAVRAFFVKEGIDANRIEAVGFGESAPKFDNSTAEGRKLNRRAEITFK